MELQQLFQDLPLDGILTLKISEGASLGQAKVSLTTVLRRASPDFVPEINASGAQCTVRKIPRTH